MYIRASEPSGEGAVGHWSLMTLLLITTMISIDGGGGQSVHFVEISKILERLTWAMGMTFEGWSI